MVHVKEGEVIAPLSIFRNVIDRLTIDFDFSGAQIALKIGHVVERIPQAELDVGKELKLPRRLRVVLGARPAAPRS